MGIDLADATARVRADRGYDAAFRRVYGRPPDVAAVVAALVTFQKSLVAEDSRFDRFYLGGDSAALTPSEQRGWALFAERNQCAGCHPPVPSPEANHVILFKDGNFHNLGIGYDSGRMADVGRYAVTHNPEDWGKFVTPSLRNVELTAPYMHDGSLATLEDVVEFYAEGGKDNPNRDIIMGRRSLTTQDKADLVAFLKTLTTEWLTDSVEVRKRLLDPPRRP